MAGVPRSPSLRPAFLRRRIVLDADHRADTPPVNNLATGAVRGAEGRPAFKAIDFNFWGLTFARDGDQFYATLRTGGRRYLVRGSIDAKQAEVIHTDVECPSLSPDGTRIVYKKPFKGVLEMGWRLHVLDLATGEEHALNQVTRSVDDQVDWFDADHIVYHDSAPDGTGIWILSTDGVQPPHLLLPNAYSPAVQR